MSRIHFFGASCPRDHGDGRVVMEAPLETWGGHGWSMVADDPRCFFLLLGSDMCSHSPRFFLFFSVHGSLLFPYQFFGLVLS